MGEPVSAEVASLSEWLVADVTLKGFFAGVSPLMGLGFSTHVSVCLVHRNRLARQLVMCLP